MKISKLCIFIFNICRITIRPGPRRCVQEIIMIKLADLLSKVTEHSQIRITDIPDGERLVCRADLLQTSVIPDPETLYLCTDEALLHNQALMDRLSSGPNRPSPYPLISPLAST